MPRVYRLRNRVRGTPTRWLDRGGGIYESPTVNRGRRRLSRRSSALPLLDGVVSHRWQQPDLSFTYLYLLNIAYW